MLGVLNAEATTFHFCSFLSIFLSLSDMNFATLGLLLIDNENKNDETRPHSSDLVLQHAPPKPRHQPGSMFFFIVSSNIN